MILKLAFRNLRRNKRRTILTSITVAVAAIVFIVHDCFTSGFTQSSMQSILDFSNSAIQITTKEYEKESESVPLKYGVDYNEIKEALKNNGDIKAVTKRTDFLTTLSWAGNSYITKGRVIDPDTDKDVLKTSQYIEGEYLKNGETGNAVIGKNVAIDLKIGVGDMIIISADTKYGARNADMFTVIGIAKTDSPDINKSVLINYEDANNLLELDNLITHINISLKTEKGLSFNKYYAPKTEELKKTLQNHFPNYFIYSYDDAAGVIKATEKFEKVGQFIFVGVIILISVIGISNSILMSFYERIREIGAMRAIGFTAKDILMLFSFEGMSVGIIGGVIGIIVGFIINLLLVNVGFPMGKLYGSMVDTLPTTGTIYSDWNILRYIIALAFSVLSALFAGFLPARKASKMEVTEALRYI